MQASRLRRCRPRRPTALTLSLSRGRRDRWQNRGPLHGWRWRFVVAAFHVGDHAVERIAPPPPRSHKMADFDAWRAACEWVADPANIPPGARFLVPRLSQTFRLVHRPQRRGHVEGRAAGRRGHCRVVAADSGHLHDRLPREGGQVQVARPTWARSGLRAVAAKYDADYIITEPDRHRSLTELGVGLTTTRREVRRRLRHHRERTEPLAEARRGLSQSRVRHLSPAASPNPKSEIRNPKS